MHGAGAVGQAEPNLDEPGEQRQDSTEQVRHEPEPTRPEISCVRGKRIVGEVVLRARYEPSYRGQEQYRRYNQACTRLARLRCGGHSGHLTPLLVLVCKEDSWTLSQKPKGGNRRTAVIEVRALM